MHSITPLPANDPVSQAVLRSTRSAGHFPVPLVSTTYDINIIGGLADVVAKRTFHNSETTTIEATLTLPLPVHAVLYSLEARIGSRVVKGMAKARAAAREIYEDAVERGKTAVLHEELLKGVHMLSVAHVAPGTEIEVTARFAIALSWIGGRALLRIPTTVGDVYGSSGLPDSDVLLHGGTMQAADIKIASDTGTPVLLGGTLVNGTARIWLDAPINVDVKDWSAHDLLGRAADGSSIVLSVKPAPIHDANLDAAILVDHSGSMGEPCSGNARITKHAAVLLGLTEAADDLRESDRLNLWEFDNFAVDLGTAHASGWRTLLHMLSVPNGGTEIGGAIDLMLAQRPVRDVLLVTDGKSHAIDVQRLAAKGVRFTIVLIGDDSLEANVGHLTSLTGGEIFVPEGTNVAAAVRSALRSLRLPRSPHESSELGVVATRANRAGMAMTATWGAPSPHSAKHDSERAVAAYAASLRMPSLSSEAAAKLAEAEGLVTHLTSLILVDEEGTAQSGLPAARKIALPSPNTHATTSHFCAMIEPAMDISHARYCKSVSYAPRHAQVSRADSDWRVPSPGMKRSIAGGVVRESVSPADIPTATLEPSQVKSLAHHVRGIDWRTEGQRLAEGNMIGLAHDIADAIDEAASYGIVKRVAKRLGLAPRLLVIALLARARASDDRHADRVARAILTKVKARDITGLAERLGLGVRVGA